MSEVQRGLNFHKIDGPQVVDCLQELPELGDELVDDERAREGLDVPEADGLDSRAGDHDGLASRRARTKSRWPSWNERDPKGLDFQ